MAPRIVNRRRHAYRTASNRVKPVRVPSNKLVAHYHKKRVSPPGCRLCKQRLPGLPAIDAYAYRKLSRSQRTVARVYGGNLCCNCLKTRIMRAFLLEEQKVVRKIMKIRSRLAAARK